jgi:hypothetical protein
MNFLNLFLMLLAAVLVGYLIRPINNLITYLSFRKKYKDMYKNDMVEKCKHSHSFVKAEGVLKGEVCTKCGFATETGEQLSKPALQSLLVVLEIFKKREDFLTEQVSKLSKENGLDSEKLKKTYLELEQSMIKFDKVNLKV